MKLSLWLSRRLSLDTGGSATGVVIAVAGMALAVMVMEFTLAIVTGFKHEIERKLMGFDAQITIHPPYLVGHDQPLEAVRADSALVGYIGMALPADAEIAVAIRQPGILKTDSDFEGVLFEARSPHADFGFERSNIVEGQWPDYLADSCANDIVLSTLLASRLGLAPGDRLYTTFIVDGAVKMRRNRVAALFRSDFGEYDRQVVYCSMPLLQGVAGLDSLSGTRIDIRGLEAAQIDPAALELQRHLQVGTATGAIEGYYPVTTVHQTGAMYFNWLALLDTNVVVIFILMLCVAALTMVSSLFILILERVRTIGILRALGASRGTVRRIFVFMALKVVGIGMVIGNVVGLGLLAAQKVWHVVPLNPEMYYLSSVPVQLDFWPLLLLNLGIVAAAWLILVLPASLAATVPPAEAARYD